MTNHSDKPYRQKRDPRLDTPETEAKKAEWPLDNCPPDEPDKIQDPRDVPVPETACSTCGGCGRVELRQPRNVVPPPVVTHSWIDCPVCKPEHVAAAPTRDLILKYKFTDRGGKSVYYAFPGNDKSDTHRLFEVRIDPQDAEWQPLPAQQEENDEPSDEM